MSFDDQPCLVGPRIALSPMVAGDLPALRAAASDPKTWEQHPGWDRYKPEVFDPYFEFLLTSGGTLVARDDGKVIGCSRYYPVPDQSDDIGIGFTFLTHSYWGGSWNREMKRLMIEHAFNSFARIWFHIAPDNTRSQIATTRLGAVWQYDAVVPLAPGAGLNKCYVMTPASWTAANAD